MSRSTPKFHVVCDDVPICGQSSVVALVNSADCSRCCKLVADMVSVLMNAADGDDVQGQAQAILNRMRYHRPQDAKESP